MNAAAGDAESHFAAGTAALLRGDWGTARDIFQEALRCDPELPAAHANLAYALAAQGEAAAAEQHYRLALTLNPCSVQAWINYAALRLKEQDFGEAEAFYREALRLDPGNSSAWSGLGVVLATLKQEAEAEACYRQALRHQPDHRLSQFNLAYLLLRQGRFEEGWPCFEARASYAALARLLPVPRWQGEPLAGRHILIGVEGGYGDMIQFVRYVRLLKSAGAAKISLLCQTALKRLFAHLPAVNRVIGLDEAWPEADWDCWVPALSLPYGFKTRLETIPAQLPYLSLPDERIAAWAESLNALPPGLRVGLVWQGNPHFENDRERSLPSLDCLRPLWSLPGIQFVSLQTEARAAIQIQAQQQAILDLGARVADFEDTAAIIMQLDLVISVDTAVAHLTGALGRPCWVLLPYLKTDWRWLGERDDSPWYPGVLRLFRQPSAGDWLTPIQALRAALAGRLSGA